MERTDHVVIGSGIAGLSYALKAARHARVTVLTKRDRQEANTRYAQGGIAAVWHPADSLDAHEEDTFVAGAGLCDAEAVRITVAEGPDRVRELIELGVEFSRNEEGEYDLGMEGGHSGRRILHAGDITGSEIQRALVSAASNHPNITIHDHLLAVNLITRSSVAGQPVDDDRAIGVYALEEATGIVHRFLGQVVVLATGGFGKVYLYTSNPDVATGDGHAMALRAGARMGNMEFVQFHPTCLYHPHAKSFLISEALRGEGGRLRRADGTAFMQQYHPLKDLAPRDIVARAIDKELKESGDDSVFLDMTHLDRPFVEERFPNIHARCLQLGIDMVEQPIPVVPAAHYACGGVVVDEHGCSSIPGLYAIGEVTCTGLHGANRLASNSLLEACVYAHRAAAHAKTFIEDNDEPEEPATAWNSQNARNPEELVMVTHNWEEIRRLMWNYVGIVRSTKRLIRARARIDLVIQEIHQYYWDFTITRDLIELRNIALVAKCIIESALLRRESRGLHYTLDYPETNEALRKPTILTRADLGL